MNQANAIQTGLRYNGVDHNVRRLDRVECEHLLATLPDKQRHRDGKRVRTYAAALNSGTWEYIGDPIRIDSDGLLIDGQHRVQAMLDADVYPDVLVISNLDSERAYAVIDGGKPRNTGDYFKHQGVHNCILSAAASRSAMLNIAGVPAFQAPNTIPAHRAIYKFYEEHADKFEWAIEQSSPLSSFFGSRASLVGVIVTAEMSGFSRDDIADLLPRLIRGGTGSGMLGVLYIMLARDNPRARKRLDARERGNLFAKALYMDLVGKSTKALSIGKTDTYPFIPE